MATIIRDRVQDMPKKGMTLAQVTDAKTAFDYAPLYARPATPRLRRAGLQEPQRQEKG